MSKKVNKLTEPNMRLYFLLAAVFCAVTLWIEPILGLVEAGVMALTYVYFRRTAQKRREGIQRYVEDMTDDVASAGKSSMLSAPFAMMVFRPDTQEVLWSNESFLQLTGMRENLFDNRLEDTLPGFPAQWLLEGKEPSALKRSSSTTGTSACSAVSRIRVAAAARAGFSR